MSNPTINLHDYAAENKAKYPVGSRLVIIKMQDDRLINPYIKTPPYPAGLRGTVKLVDDMGQVHCLFDDGRSGLALNEADEFRPLTEKEIEEETALTKILGICEADYADAFYDALWDEMYEQFTSDDDTPYHKYAQLTRRYLTEKDPAVKHLIDDIMMSLTGWSFPTLLRNALNCFENAKNRVTVHMGAKHMSEVVEGDRILYDGVIYTATDDAYLANTDIGKEWNCDVEGNGPEVQLYASYFKQGYVDIVDEEANKDGE